MKLRQFVALVSHDQKVSISRGIVDSDRRIAVVHHFQGTVFCIQVVRRRTGLSSDFECRWEAAPCHLCRQCTAGPGNPNVRRRSALRRSNVSSTARVDPQAPKRGRQSAIETICNPFATCTSLCAQRLIRLVEGGADLSFRVWQFPKINNSSTIEV
jgi:hypothetical protein